MEGRRMTGIGGMPEEWGVARLGEKCEFLDSQRVPIKEQDRTKRRGSYPYYGAQGIIDWIDDYIFDGEYILLAEDGGNLHSKKLPLAYKVSGKFWVNNHAHVLKVKNDEIIDKYLLYVLNFIDIRTYIVGSAQPKLNQSDAIKIKIPLPPLPEQRRIAEVLGTVDSAIQKVGGAIAGTERLKKGLMQRLLTRGIRHERFRISKELGCEIPEEWNVVKLEDVTGHVGSGLTPRGGALTYLDQGIPLIRSQNVLMNKLDLSDVAYISKETHKYMARSVVFSGDLLLNITGASIGRVAIIPKSVSEANVNQHVCCIRFSEVIVPIFASYYLSSANGQNQIMSFQAGATRQGLNYQQVKSILIPLPPLPEQRRIAEILSAVDRKLELERRRKEKLERVKKGLMSELLTGRKRVKVENDGNI